MEDTMMKTAEDIIQDLQELSPEEREKVSDYFTSEMDGIYREEHYSDEDMAKIEQDALEAKQGINVVGPFRGEEAVEYLRSLMRQE